MKQLSEADQRLLSRLVDGELAGEELTELERRLLREPRLREAVEGQRETREWFEKVRVQESRDGVTVPAGFAARVVEQVRRLPDREELLAEVGELGERESEERTTLSLGRGILAAAALIFGVSLLFAGGLVRPADSDQLEAADDQVIERIDAEMRALEEAEPERAVERR